jgi:hypothetical protein
VLRIGRESKTGLACEPEHLVVRGKRFTDQPVEACARSGANESVEQQFSKPQPWNWSATERANSALPPFSATL